MRAQRSAPAQIATGVVTVGLGIAAVIASTLEWVDLSEIGLAPLNPSGIGVDYSTFGLTFGLGWFTIGLGCLLACAGVLIAVGLRWAGHLVIGCGVAILCIAIAVCLRPLRLTWRVAQLGAESATDGSYGAPSTGIYALLVTGGLALVAGAVSVSLPRRTSKRPFVAPAAAIVAGLVVGVIAVAVVWWWNGRPLSYTPLGGLSDLAALPGRW